MSLFFIISRQTRRQLGVQGLLSRKEKPLTSSTKAILAPGGTRPSSSACRLGLARMRRPALCRPTNRRSFDGAAVGRTPPA